MTNPIVGYRELTDDEIDLINAIKAHGAHLQNLLMTVTEAQADGRWVSIAQTHLQQGMMALTRAVAKPEGF